jgi:hypothetical protein
MVLLVGIDMYISSRRGPYDKLLRMGTSRSSFYIRLFRLFGPETEYERTQKIRFITLLSSYKGQMEDREERHAGEMEDIHLKIIEPEWENLALQVKNQKLENDIWGQKHQIGRMNSENYILMGRSDYWKEECGVMVKKFERVDKDIHWAMKHYEVARELIGRDKTVLKEAAAEAAEAEQKRLEAHVIRGPIPKMEKMVER